MFMKKIVYNNRRKKLHCVHCKLALMTPSSNALFSQVSEHVKWQSKFSLWNRKYFDDLICRLWNSLSSLLLFHSYVFLQWKRCLCWLPPLGTCAGTSCRWGKFTSNPTLKQFSVHDGVQLLCKWCYILGSKLQICVSSLAPDYKGHKINVHLHCSVICTHQFRVEVWY